LQTLQALGHVRMVFRKLDEEAREGGSGLAAQEGVEIFGGHAVRLPEVGTTTLVALQRGGQLQQADLSRSRLKTGGGSS
jgi:hypothetical protein